jgi:hypothetical protein
VTNAAGAVVIPKGSKAELVIRRVANASTVTGSSDLALDLQWIKVGGTPPPFAGGGIGAAIGAATG